MTIVEPANLVAYQSHQMNRQYRRLLIDAGIAPREYSALDRWQAEKLLGLQLRETIRDARDVLGIPVQGLIRGTANGNPKVD